MIRFLMRQLGMCIIKCIIFPSLGSFCNKILMTQYVLMNIQEGVL